LHEIFDPAQIQSNLTAKSAAKYETADTGAR